MSAIDWNPVPLIPLHDLVLHYNISDHENYEIIKSWVKDNELEIDAPNIKRRTDHLYKFYIEQKAKGISTFHLRFSHETGEFQYGVN